MKTLLILIASLSLAACATNRAKEASNSHVIHSADGVNTVTIANMIPYKKGAPVAMDIRRECSINTALSKYIQTYGREDQIKVRRVLSLRRIHHGNVLKVHFLNVISRGHAFTGHMKYAKIEGTLYKNGRRYKSFIDARYSEGGFFGAYESSCAVLNRTVKAIGRDVAAWLAHPVNGEHMGDRG